MFVKNKIFKKSVHLLWIKRVFDCFWKLNVQQWSITKTVTCILSHFQLTHSLSYIFFFLFKFSNSLSYIFFFHWKFPHSLSYLFFLPDFQFTHSWLSTWTCVTWWAWASPSPEARPPLSPSTTPSCFWPCNYKDPFLAKKL